MGLPVLLVDELSMEFHCDLQLSDRSHNVNGIAVCSSVFANRILVAASRLLPALAACVILLSFAAGLRKLYWSGCMKAATVICQKIFSILALVIFLLKILLKSASKSSFFRSGVEIRFWSYNFRRRCA